MKSRKVLVTGGAGFVGREIVTQLLRRGYKVVVVDKKPKSSMKHFLSKELEYFHIDLTEKGLVEKAMSGIGYCLHLASESGGIGFLRENPETILANNTKIDSHVFTAAAKEKIRRIIFISSSMVFETAKKFPMAESDLDNIQAPRSAYSQSKLKGEELCRTFNKKFGLKYVICRLSNVYGLDKGLTGRVGHSHVIPDMIQKVVSLQYPLEIFGSGRQRRCFIHVSDIARGIILAMESEKAVNEDINITGTRETSVKDIAEMIFKMLRPDIQYKQKLIKGFSNDVKRNLLSNAKAKKLLNWKPEKELEEGLPAIVEWMTLGS